MRAFITILLLLSFVLAGDSAPDRRRAILKKKVAAAGGVSPSFSETFEGSQNPQTGYDNTGWTESGSTITPHFNTSPAPLVGSFSLQVIQSAELTYIERSITSKSEYWAYFQISLTSKGAGATPVLFRFRNGGADEYYVSLNDSRQVLIVDAIGANIGTTTDAMATGTTYHVFIHVLKGSGANGVASVEFSTTASFTGSGNKFASMSNGAVVSDMDTLRIGGSFTTTTYILDKIYLYDVQWPVPVP